MVTSGCGVTIRPLQIMENKPITPALHQLLDYGLGAAQMLAPKRLGANSKAVKLYQIAGVAFLGVNVLTDAPYGLKRLLPMRVHQAADTGFLIAMGAATFLPAIRKDDRTRRFHLGFLALALTNYFLSDYANTKDPEALPMPSIH